MTSYNKAKPRAVHVRPLVHENPFYHVTPRLRRRSWKSLIPKGVQNVELRDHYKELEKIYQTLLNERMTPQALDEQRSMAYFQHKQQLADDMRKVLRDMSLSEELRNQGENSEMYRKFNELRERYQNLLDDGFDGNAAGQPGRPRSQSLGPMLLPGHRVNVKLKQEQRPRQMQPLIMQLQNQQPLQQAPVAVQPQVLMQPRVAPLSAAAAAAIPAQPRNAAAAPPPPPQVQAQRRTGRASKPASRLTAPAAPPQVQPQPQPAPPAQAPAPSRAWYDYLRHPFQSIQQALSSAYIGRPPSPPPPPSPFQKRTGAASRGATKIPSVATTATQAQPTTARVTNNNNNSNNKPRGRPSRPATKRTTYMPNDVMGNWERVLTSLKSKGMGKDEVKRSIVNSMTPDKANLVLGYVDNAWDSLPTRTEPPPPSMDNFSSEVKQAAVSTFQAADQNPMEIDATSSPERQRGFAALNWLGIQPEETKQDNNPPSRGRSGSVKGSKKEGARGRSKTPKASRKTPATSKSRSPGRGDRMKEWVKKAEALNKETSKYLEQLEMTDGDGGRPIGLTPEEAQAAEKDFQEMVEEMAEEQRQQAAQKKQKEEEKKQREEEYFKKRKEDEEKKLQQATTVVLDQLKNASGERMDHPVVIKLETTAPKKKERKTRDDVVTATTNFDLTKGVKAKREQSREQSILNTRKKAGAPEAEQEKKKAPTETADPSGRLPVTRVTDMGTQLQKRREGAEKTRKSLRVDRQQLIRDVQNAEASLKSRNQQQTEGIQGLVQALGGMNREVQTSKAKLEAEHQQYKQETDRIKKELKKNAEELDEKGRAELDRNLQAIDEALIEWAEETNKEYGEKARSVQAKIDQKAAELRKRIEQMELVAEQQKAETERVRQLLNSPQVKDRAKIKAARDFAARVQPDARLQQQRNNDIQFLQQLVADFNAERAAYIASEVRKARLANAVQVAHDRAQKLFDSHGDPSNPRTRDAIQWKVEQASYKDKDKREAERKKQMEQMETIIQDIQRQVEEDRKKKPLFPPVPGKPTGQNSSIKPTPADQGTPVDYDSGEDYDPYDDSDEDYDPTKLSESDNRELADTPDPSKGLYQTVSETTPDETADIKRFARMPEPRTEWYTSDPSDRYYPNPLAYLRATQFESGFPSFQRLQNIFNGSYHAPHAWVHTWATDTAGPGRHDLALMILQLFREERGRQIRRGAYDTDARRAFERARLFLRSIIDNDTGAEGLQRSYNTGKGIIGAGVRHNTPRFINSMVKPAKIDHIDFDPADFVEEQKRRTDEWRDKYKEFHKRMYGVEPTNEKIESAFPSSAEPISQYGLPGMQKRYL